MAKRKARTYQNVIKQAAELTQGLRRMEEADDSGNCSCVTCDYVGHYKDMNGGHYIPRGKLWWKIETVNIWPQCTKCNNWLNGAPAEYTMFMVGKHGQEFVNQMLADKNLGRRYNKAELLERIAELKGLIKEQEERLGNC